MSKFGQIDKGMGSFGSDESTKGFGTGGGASVCKATFEVSPKAGDAGKGEAFGFWEYKIYMGDCPECVFDGQCKRKYLGKDQENLPCRLLSPDVSDAPDGSVIGSGDYILAGLVMRPLNATGGSDIYYNQIDKWLGKYPKEAADACKVWFGNSTCFNGNASGGGPYWEVDFEDFEPEGVPGHGVSGATGENTIKIVGELEMDCIKASFGDVGSMGDLCPSVSGTVTAKSNDPMLATPFAGFSPSIELTGEMIFDCCRCGVVPDKH
jgi:hypothetical protein